MTAQVANVQAVSPVPNISRLAGQYSAVRRQTASLCKPLVAEDYVIQSMPDASPVKWHLAHTTWFFETFVLVPALATYKPFHPLFNFLFNSYYNAVGPRWSRPERGLLSRPTVLDIERYRAHVDEHMESLFSAIDPELADVVVLGIHHEQQHQELIVTDLKHAWSGNPLHPSYCQADRGSGKQVPQKWLKFAEGLGWIGHEGRAFAFDNETTRHRVFMHGFQIAGRLVSNADYLAFMADGGYERPELWLSDGWNARRTHDWKSPLYWHKEDHEWLAVTLAGLETLSGAEPVCHISFYEADAFARWAGARLPTEAEWETAAAQAAVDGHFLEAGRFHPSASASATDEGPLYQMFGDVWQWTASAYLGYPGYKPLPGALGEYNGKFMCNQFVLRGASCATPRSHARRTYRNFFPPEARWQFSGLRLAKDLE